MAVNGSLQTRLNSIVAQYAPHTVICAPGYIAVRTYRLPLLKHQV